MIHQTRERLYWSCRRGMLELDLMLIPFLNDCYDALNSEEKEQFLLLLESSDVELYAWLTHHEKPSSPSFEKLVIKIREHAHDPRRNRSF